MRVRIAEAAAAMSVHPPDTPLSSVSVVMPTALRDALVEIAKANQRTLSGEMRLALQRHVELVNRLA